MIHEFWNLIFWRWDKALRTRKIGYAYQGKPIFLYGSPPPVLKYVWNLVKPLGGCRRVEKGGGYHLGDGPAPGLGSCYHAISMTSRHQPPAEASNLILFPGSYRLRLHLYLIIEIHFFFFYFFIFRSVYLIVHCTGYFYFLKFILCIL